MGRGRGVRSVRTYCLHALRLTMAMAPNAFTEYSSSRLGTPSTSACHVAAMEAGSHVMRLAVTTAAAPSFATAHSCSYAVAASFDLPVPVPAASTCPSSHTRGSEQRLANPNAAAGT
eukprot:GHVU01180658.1.p1 GENE.GHVU01180658.1~~GHVU01180658.1.p1  ORF type:complete len:117 (+),score=9.62 GHVU01180658.1:134-484(+)